jgi:hypothetical protein
MHFDPFPALPVGARARQNIAVAAVPVARAGAARNRPA